MKPFASGNGVKQRVFPAFQESSLMPLYFYKDPHYYDTDFFPKSENSLVFF